MEQAKKKILHVDDEIDTLKSVKTILQNEGYEVVSVSMGDAALEEMRRADFDLALLDIMMPDMSGWDLLTRISKLKSDYRVVFLTVLEATKARLKELEEFGIKDYITKPFDKDDFLARVKKGAGELGAQ